MLYRIILKWAVFPVAEVDQQSRQVLHQVNQVPSSYVRIWEYDIKNFEPKVS